MDEPHLLYAVEGGIATITLNRPEARNAFDPARLLDFHQPNV